MLPRILTSDTPEAIRAGYKIVRRDSMTDVPGMILSANVETGACSLRIANGAQQDLDFGPDGFRIAVSRR